MAMTKQLWSLNSLATELGRDRRTIARALADTPADGKLAGKKAWFLMSAMRALGLDDEAAPSGVRSDDGGGLLDVIRDRLSSWKTIYSDEPREHFPFEMTAEILAVSPNMLLTWLRVGCPYHGMPGDWKTGAGFSFQLSWVAEWYAMLAGVVERAGDADLARQLGIASRK